MQIYTFGYDNETHEFILWKRGRKTPVARIPEEDASTLEQTLNHVQAHNLAHPQEN